MYLRMLLYFYWNVFKFIGMYFRMLLCFYWNVFKNVVVFFGNVFEIIIQMLSDYTLI